MTCDAAVHGKNMLVDVEFWPDFRYWGFTLYKPPNGRTYRPLLGLCWVTRSMCRTARASFGNLVWACDRMSSLSSAMPLGCDGAPGLHNRQAPHCRYIPLDLARRQGAGWHAVQSITARTCP